MSSASDGLRSDIKTRFNTLDYGPVFNWLEERGWSKSDNGILYHPSYKQLVDIPDEEWACVLFLCHEWDYDIDPGIKSQGKK